MIVTKETATVYRGATRRYFSKDAAYLNVARDALNKKYMERCDCDKGDPSVGLGPSPCGYHADPERNSRVARRYANRLKRKELEAERKPKCK
jgi:hypothetical protein